MSASDRLRPLRSSDRIRMPTGTRHLRSNIIGRRLACPRHDPRRTGSTRRSRLGWRPRRPRSASCSNGSSPKALDTLDHPGIVFRDGPTGRRAALAVGPDVWEVISALRHTTGTQEQRVGMLAEQFDLHPRHIRTAIDYAAAHRDDIDTQVAANDEAAQRTAQVAQARDDLMASQGLRFLIDQMFPHATCQLLNDRGHDAVHVRDRGVDARPDAEVVAVASAEER